MEWTLAIVALILLGVAAFSQRLTTSSLTPTMVFVVCGVLIGPEILNAVDFSIDDSGLRTLAEASLALVLFSDASRIQPMQLRREFGIPTRLLGLGLPLTIILGAVGAGLIFDQLSVGEAMILGVLLAPTDAALGHAVVSDRRVPVRVRQGLNVESGLNDGICVPLLFIAVAFADVESQITSERGSIQLLAEEIGYGVLGGVIAGALLALIASQAIRRGMIERHWRRVLPVAAAALAYGVASALDGSGFIAAFAAGMTFRVLLGHDPVEFCELTDELGDIFSGITFLIFGALLLAPAIGALDWQIALYAALSLTLIRMLPAAIAMVGSRARWPTVGFLGWFGPRGLASIVFAAIVIEQSELPNQELITTVVYLTVGLSVFAHGLSAAPLASRYSRWIATQDADEMSEMKDGATQTSRTRRGWSN